MTATIDDLDPREREWIGTLVESTIDHIWYGSKAAHEDSVGCCPACCAPCSTIAALYLDGQLDAWYSESPLPNGSEYDSDHGGVSREFLLCVWEKCLDLGCHEPLGPDHDEVVLLLDRLRAEVDR